MRCCFVLFLRGVVFRVTWFFAAGVESENESMGCLEPKGVGWQKMEQNEMGMDEARDQIDRDKTRSDEMG